MFGIQIQIRKEGLQKTTLNCNNTPKPTLKSGNTPKTRFSFIFRSSICFETT